MPRRMPARGPSEESVAIAEAELERAPSDRGGQPEAIPWRIQAASIAAVGLGGALGAVARYRVAAWISSAWGTAFPWGTLVINVSGAFVLSLFLTFVSDRRGGRPLTRLLVATGFLGAYTTFSTFAFETVTFLDGGHPARALLYVAASLVLGLVAVAAGITTARAVDR